MGSLPVILGIDIDGVCANFGACANDFLEEKTGFRIEPTRWEWFRDYPNGEHWWREFWKPGVASFYLAKAKPVPGAASCLSLLWLAGHEIQYITHRNPRYFEVTQAWLHGHRFPCVGNLTHVEKNGDKSEVPCDLYLDDHVDNVRTLLRSGQQAFVFDAAYNRHAEFLPRAKGWPDFVRVVLERAYGVAA